MRLNNFIDKEADITALGLVAVPEIVKLIDASVPVMMNPLRLLVPWPEEESRLLAPIRPFQLTVNYICQMV